MGLNYGVATCDWGSCGGDLYYYLIKTAHKQEPSLTWPSEFRRVFGSLGAEFEMLVETLHATPPLHHDLEELATPTWGCGRILLLGDAAHAMTPNLGQGAAMAIEDAFALSDALADGIKGAIAHWENLAACFARDTAIRLVPAFLTNAQHRSLIVPGWHW